MANMSNCRFQDTLSDLMGCYDAMTEEDFNSFINELNAAERNACIKLIEICGMISNDFSDEIYEDDECK